MTAKTATTDGFVERVELAGHIIDSLLLPKVLDHITAAGGAFRIEQITDRPGPQRSQLCPDRGPRPVGRAACSRSWPTSPTTARRRLHSQDARLVAADIAGAFPEGFYSTTNQRTEVRIGGQWIEVQDQEMDCGVAGRSGSRNRPLPGDDRRANRRAVRRRPRRRARPSAGRETQAPRLRVHEQPRLDREAQGRRDPADRPRADPHQARRGQDARSSAGRRSSTPAASSTSRS